MYCKRVRWDRAACAAGARCRCRGRRRSWLRWVRWLRSLLLPLVVHGGCGGPAGLAGTVVVGAKQGLEGVELPVPEAFVVADPFRTGVQGACVEVAGVHAALHLALDQAGAFEPLDVLRSEEHTSELQSLMRSSYAVF